MGFSFTAEFVECTFGGSVTKASFYGRPQLGTLKSIDPPRQINEFRGNDFSRARLSDVSFRDGIDISAQRWPEGDAYVRVDRFGERAQCAERELSRWPDAERKRLGLLMLSHYRDWHQDEIFVPRHNLRVPEIEDSFWDLIQRCL